MYCISKGLGTPPPERQHGRALKYPWAKMEVGDSFEVTYDQRPGKTPYAIVNSLAGSAASWSKRNREGQWKFTTRQSRTGVRVWRTE